MDNKVKEQIKKLKESIDYEILVFSHSPSLCSECKNTHERLHEWSDKLAAILKIV